MKSAPFKRDDALLDMLSVAVLVIPGTRASENRTDNDPELDIRDVTFK